MTWQEDLLAEAVGHRDAEFGVTTIAQDRGLTGVIRRVAWRAGAEHGVVVLKVPRCGSEFERAAREVTFLHELAAHVNAPVPRCLAARADRAADRVALVFDEAPGRDGDITVGCTPDDAWAVLQALAPMYARAWDDDELRERPWLPTWGSGTAGAEAPFRRTARRFRARTPMFLERFASGAQSELPALFDRIGEGLEERLARLPELPSTLIHADLHLDNIRLDPPTVLDWQSVSIGPAAYDLARFLGESLRGRDQDTVDDLLLAFRADLVARGVTVAHLDELVAQFDTMLVRVLVGLVSGYGRADPPPLPARVRSAIEAAIGPCGLVAMIARRASSGR